jgi:GTPase KRas protein
MLLLGDNDVGKTSFAYRFSQNEYQTSFERTLFDEEHKKDCNIGPDDVCTIKLLDSWVPQSTYVDLDDEELVPCDAYILMYAINSMSTFQDLSRACRQIPLNAKQNTKLKMILIGTKCDDDMEREVSYQDGFALSKQLGCCAFFETSAKTNENVDAAVLELVQVLRASRKGRRYPWTKLFRLLAASKSFGNGLQLKVSKPMRASF